MQRLLAVAEDALRWSLKQIEWPVLQHDAALDEVEHILHLLLGTERSLQNVAVWHLDSDLGSRVVRLPLHSLELNGASVPKLILLLLLGEEGKGAPTLILICYFFIVRAADKDTSTAATSTSADHGRRWLQLCLLVLHIGINSPTGCGSLSLSLLHHCKELVSVHGLTSNVGFLVVDLDFAVFHAVL